MQVITDPAGEILWISPALPGRTHDLTAARTHRIIRIIRICERQEVPVLADRAYTGAGPLGYHRPQNGHPAASSPPPSAPSTAHSPRPGHPSNAV
jgi:hypothetical protein